MNTIIICLTAFNFFIAGVLYEKEFKWADIRNAKIRSVVLILLFSLFGYLIVTIGLIAIALLRIWNEIDGLLQVSFYFNLYFTKKFDNATLIQLERIESNCNKYHNKSTLKDRHYRHCMDLLFSKNNYSKKA